MMAMRSPALHREVHALEHLQIDGSLAKAARHADALRVPVSVVDVGHAVAQSCRRASAGMVREARQAG